MLTSTVDRTLQWIRGMVSLGEIGTSRLDQDLAAQRSQFIEAMSQIVSGVSIVTTDGPAGRYGLTVSSFCSLDADPPMVLVCVNQRSPLLYAIIENRVLAVNILAESHAALADAFAGRPQDGEAYDFGRASWIVGETKSPLLEGAVALFDCDLAEHYEAATHVIFTAKVRRSVHDPQIPLLYTRRAYGRPGPLLPESAPREDME
jgi:flavin reductase (DIM6/NTAB) family NADH-FMN oxidoreductase RutF